MKLLHFSDLHLDPSTQENTLPAVDEIVRLAERERPDLIVNAGDLSMKRGSLAPWVSLKLREMHVALAEIAPTIVVAGNHDLATAGSEVGTVMGALAKAESPSYLLHLFERPGVWRYVAAWNEVVHSGASDLNVACLPYPSKSWLLAQRPEIRADELNATLSALLLETLQGLAAQIPAGERAILVYHGSIAGARTDSEQTMTTEMDLVLNEADIPACFEAVLCGHIHRPQQIGRAVYCGSPAPLTFAEEKSAHGCTVWSDGEESTEWSALPDSLWKYRHVALPVAHPLRTYDLRQDESRVRRLEVEPGSRCRVRLMLRPGEEPEALRQNYVAALTTLGAHEVRVEIERPDEVRTAGPEVHAGLGLPELLGMYSVRHAMIPSEGLDVLAHATTLDAKLRPEDRALGHAGDYRLLHLEWSNWKSYGPDQELDFSTLGRLVAIEGENATGKSNLAELEAFALYGRFIRGRQGLAEAVRIGANEAKVSAEFECGSWLWRIERRIKVNSKGVGAMDLQLARRGCETAQWLPQNDGTARETQALIEQLVGPMELYLQTRFASQGQIDSLLDLTPSELKDVLQQALATSLFEARETLARPALQEAERVLEKHEAGLAVWRELAGERQGLEWLVESKTDTRRAASVAMAAKESAQRLAEHVAILARETLQEFEQQAKAWEDSGDLAVRAIGRVTGLEASLKVWDVAIERAWTAQKATRRLPELRGQLQALKSADQIRRERKAVLEAEERTLSGLQREYEATIRHQRQELNAKVERLSVDLDRAKRSGALIASVPFGEKCVEAKCQFVADAAQMKARIPDLERDLKAASDRRVAGDPEALRRITEHSAAVEKARTALAAAAVDEIALSRLAREIGELEALEPAVEAGRQAQAKKELAEQEMPHLKAEMERLVAAHGELGERPSLEASQEEVRKTEAELAIKGAELEGAKAAVDRATEELATARAQLLQAAEAEEKVRAATEEGAVLEGKRRVAAVWLEACGRDGLPFLMLERALPALESHANHFLCDDAGSGLRIEIEGLRELQSGETRSEVVIRYRNDLGTHSLAAASGFERTAIGYALRAALAQIQAEAQGFKVSHWIADEGWGVFDELNLVRIGQPMLRRLAERFGRVIVISHQAPIVAVCETRLRVEADPVHGSRMVAA